MLISWDIWNEQNARVFLKDYTMSTVVKTEAALWSMVGAKTANHLGDVFTEIGTRRATLSEIYLGEGPSPSALSRGTRQSLRRVSFHAHPAKNSILFWAFFFRQPDAIAL